MKDLSFSSGGIALKLSVTYPEKIKIIPLPEKILLPLKQDELSPLTPLVKKKSEIKAGDTLAKGPYSNILSPVDGKVSQIKKDFQNYLGEEVGAIEIEVDQQSTYSKKTEDTRLLSKIISGGIIDIQKRVLPLVKKIEIAQKYKVKTLIINGLEEILTNGKNYYFLQKKKEIIKQGIKVLAKLLNPKKIIIALYKDFRIIELDDIIDSSVGEIVYLKNKYPQHKTPILIRTILKQDYPLDQSIEKLLKITILDLETVYEVGKLFNGEVPYREKLVTIVKGDLTQTEIVETTIGTPISYILEQLNIDLESISKIVINGTISGTPLSSLDYPITKEIGLIFFQQKGQECKFSDAVCIKCGECVEVCPMNLMPLFISGYSQSKQFDFLKKFNIFSCIECGCCAYVCPVNIPLVQWIKYGKANLLKT